MLSKAEILARMGLDNTAFKNGMRKSEGFLKKSVGRMMRTFAPLIGLAGIAGGTRASIQLAEEIKNLSGVANTTTSEFQRLAAGAEQYSVEQQKLADIFKDTNDKVGDFMQNGAGPLKDFFENIAPQVGITADEFRNLSGPDALQLYFNSLEKANISQGDMIFYMESIASDASRLIPLLKDSGAEFKRLGDQAEAAGAVMKDKTIESLNRTSDRMTRMKRNLTVLWSEILVKIVPALQILGQGFGFLGDIIGVTAAWIVSKAVPALQILGQGFGFLGDIIGVTATWIVSFGKTLGSVIKATVKPALTAFSSLSMSLQGLGAAIKGNFSEAGKLLGNSKNQFIAIVDDIKAIPQAMSDAFDGIGKSGKQSLDVLGDQADKRKKQLDEAIKQFTKKTAKESLDVLGDKADQRKKQLDDAIAELTGKADKEAARLRSEQESREKKIREMAGKRNATKRERDEAEALLKEQDEKRLQELRLALLEAELTGKEKLIQQAREELALEEKVQQIISETNVSRERAIELAEGLTGKKKNSGRTKDGLRFETFAGSNNKRNKVFFKNGRKLGTAEEQTFRAERFANGSEIAGVPDANSTLKATAAAKANIVTAESWKGDITLMRKKLDKLEIDLSAAN